MEIITVCDNEFGENTYIVSCDDGIYVIDPGASVEGIKSAIAEGRRPKQRQTTSALGDWRSAIKGVFLTHAHYDHILSLSAFDPKTVWLHEQEKGVIENPEMNMSVYNSVPLSFKGLNYYSGPSRELSGFKFFHVPGHTQGCVLIQKDDSLFTGDTLFYDTVGRTDLPTGDSRALKKSLKLFSAFDKNITCYPGHGDPFKLHDTFRLNYFLKERGL